MPKKMIFFLIGALLCVGMVSAAVAGSVDWKQCQGTEIRFLMNKHPFTTSIEPKVAAFEEMTGIKVNLEVFPEDQFRNKRMIELNAGGSVDGYMIMPGQAKLHYWKAGWLKPLDAYIADPALTEADWDVKDFFAGPMKGSSMDGKQIGIVINAEASLLSYRKDLFERFKVKVPETMQELEEAAKFFNGKEVDGKKMVGITLRGKGAAATSQWVDFLYSFGGSWTNAEGKSNLASPESIAAFKFYGDLLRNYGPKGGTMLHWSESTSIFMEGKAAMIFDANVFKSLYENPKESKVAGKVGYTTIPAGPAGKVPHVSNWSLAISGTSTPERQKAAWLFVQWATNKANVLDALMAGVPAGRASAWNSPDYTSKDATPDWTAGSLKSFEIGQPQWNPPVLNVPEIRDITGLVIVDAIEGKDVAASAKKAAEEMNKKMEM
ncbi:MAG: sugar ABC transporter substrate-binding protein [Deltaproteobacteria bacterium]|jgi:multiple sugar transport system substrate-binding protein|nr:sugar ABC transporter substrate-binding protein [Deltaproteobacteria bacterium]